MELTGGDLAPERLADVLPGRPLRSYPALLSTEADAMAWARSGVAEGALVAADYQVSPRGRAGLEWTPRAGTSLAFSLVLRPRLSANREGWMYTVAVSGLADALGEGTTIEWPDQVRRDGVAAGAVAVQTELGPQGVRWAVVNVLVLEAAPPRGPLLARVVEGVEARSRSPAADVLGEYVPRCETIGRRVRARLIPMGPAGAQVTGRAVRALADGALLIETAGGRRVAVRPQGLGRLEDAESEAVEASDPASSGG